MKTAAGQSKADKEVRARLRAHFERETTHVRLGDWRELGNAEVRLVGLAKDLHGTVCTCCPRRTTGGAT